MNYLFCRLQYGEGNSEINSPHQLVLNKSIHNGMVTGISNSSIVPYANLFKTHTRNYGKKYEVRNRIFSFNFI